MLTVAEETLTRLARDHGKEVSIHLYGQEVNAETYAIAKADMILKGEGRAAGGLAFGSTLSADAFGQRQFDFMLSNPPYGKSWKAELERLGGKRGLRDARFLIRHGDDAEYSLAPRVSDGQMLFLVNMAAKMKSESPLGSRIAEVHNGSPLFSGDAGSGESNIRRWLIENDWLEAIVALPTGMFYNTGIATYIWVLSNRKAERRRGKVQLIDATGRFEALKKNLGKKTRRLAEGDIGHIVRLFLAFEESEESKIFANEAFGYRKATVERPLRLEGIDPERAYGAGEIKALLEGGARRAPQGPPAIAKIHRRGVEAEPLRGRFAARAGGREAVVEYHPDPRLRDTERVPLLEEGGVEAFLRREVLPHAGDAWLAAGQVKIGYEINFNRHFYRYTPPRPLAEIDAELKAAEAEIARLLREVVG